MGRSAAANNGSSTEALYREHQGAVAAFCRSLLRDRSEAEDATQQVFLSAHRALLNGSAPREPLAWLLTVARHECYARFRRRSESPVPNGDLPDSATPDASVQVLRAGELASMWDEVAHMPPAQREAFLLREIRGLSYGQLAAELSLSPPSVRSLLMRARLRLRHRLRDVAAGLGGAQWVQTLLRLFGGGDGPSLAPSATKAAAVGIGALALVGGGGVARVTAHATRPHAAATSVDHAHARTAQQVAAAVPLHEERHKLEDRGLVRERSHSGESSSGRSGTDSGSSDVSGGVVESSGGTSSGSGHDGSGDPTATTAQPTTDGHDGGGGSTIATTSGRDGSGSGSSDGSSSGSSSGSGSTTTTTTTTTSSDSHGGGGSDGHG
jgi:RNA polymerase sigma factor (sigma-70 family)